VVEGDDLDVLRRRLRFKLSQNESVVFDSTEFTFPVGPRSMAGYVALHRRPLNIPDVYDPPSGAEFSFDRSLDERFGHRTKSMLCAPLLSRTGEAIGAIQLINKKRNACKKLLDESDVREQVIRSTRAARICSPCWRRRQASSSRTPSLYVCRDPAELEGFVRASVEAIEQRDPTTSGHSRRVADSTVGLARAVERADVGPYREVTWTRDDLWELEYASLLHDFGKIGVREEVLVKAESSFPYELENIRARFDFAVRSVGVDVLSRKLKVIERGGSGAELAALDEELTTRESELVAGFAAVCAANEPTVLKGGDFQRVEALAGETFTDLEGRVAQLLRPGEVSSLSIAQAR